MCRWRWKVKWTTAWYHGPWADANGNSIEGEPEQNTESIYTVALMHMVFNVDVHLQTPFELLPKGTWVHALLFYVETRLCNLLRIDALQKEKGQSELSMFRLCRTRRNQSRIECHWTVRVYFISSVTFKIADIKNQWTTSGRNWYCLRKSRYSYIYITQWKLAMNIDNNCENTKKRVIGHSAGAGLHVPVCATNTRAVVHWRASCTRRMYVWARTLTIADRAALSVALSVSTASPRFLGPCRVPAGSLVVECAWVVVR
jgi:hypothetical protein